MDTNTNPDKQKFSDAMSGSTSHADDTSNHEDNVEQTTDEQKAAEGEEKKTQDDGNAGGENAQEHDYKKRFDGLSSDHLKLSEEHKKVVDTNVRLVKRNPSVLDDLAEENPDLADQVVKEAFGEDSYESYKKTKELETMKESDPDRYATESRLHSLEAKERARVKSAASGFYSSKGIVENQFDPNYQKIQTELKKFTKDFVESSPDEALNIAFNIAFPQGIGGEQSAEAKGEADKAARLATDGASKAGSRGSPSYSAPKRSNNPIAQQFHAAISGAK